MGKIPSLLLKMAGCQKKLKEGLYHDPKRQRRTAVNSSYHIHLAIHTSVSGGPVCSQSQEWTIGAVKEALEAAEGFFAECLPKISDKTQRLQEAVKFSVNTCEVPIQDHPFQDVTIFIHKEVAFMAFEVASGFLRSKDYQAGRQHLQTMLKSIDKAKDSYALKREEDREVTTGLKFLMEEYLISCDIAQALESVEAGNLIYNMAKKDLELNDVEYALNKGWDALDKFREIERLAQTTMDDVNLEATAGQGFVYFDVFKMTEKAKQIFISVVSQVAFKDFNWYCEAEQRLRSMAASDPGSIIFPLELYDILFSGVQKERIMEELQPELEPIRKAAREAGTNSQQLINELYRISPPIPKKSGTIKPKPDVIKLGAKKAIKKMIFFYHPDKIDKSNLKYKILCEEITKILTEHSEKISKM